MQERERKREREDDENPNKLSSFRKTERVGDKVRKNYSPVMQKKKRKKKHEQITARCKKVYLKNA